MLQSEYDVIVKNKRLKIFLVILTAIMVVAVFGAVFYFFQREGFQQEDALGVIEIGGPIQLVPIESPHSNIMDFAERTRPMVRINDTSPENFKGILPNVYDEKK